MIFLQIFWYFCSFCLFASKFNIYIMFLKIERNHSWKKYKQLSVFHGFSTFPRIETFPNRMKAGISFHLCMQILESPLYLSSDFAKRLGGCSKRGKLQTICICNIEGHKFVWRKSICIFWLILMDGVTADNFLWHDNA